MLRILIFLLLILNLKGQGKPNVLLIAVDDLNSWVGCLEGHPDTKTPNIDRLAKSGMLFTNAHCQGTMCNPSRISIMWGKRPSTTGFYSNRYPVYKEAKFLKENISLSRLFKNSGYKTITAGKVYHSSWTPERDFDIIGPRPSFMSKLAKPVHDKPKIHHKIWDFGPQNYPETEFVDAKIASWSEQALNKKYEKPFFFAVGFMRPHVPFYPPVRIFNQFKGARIPAVKENDWDDIPDAARKITLNNEKIPSHEWMLKDNRWPQAVQSYLASVNWVDSQIGRVLDTLEKSPYAKNTIVILYSDHGYHLGEKQRWSKFSLWRNTTRVPFIIKVPGLKPGNCDKSVELLSIYSTLSDLCSIEKNNNIEGHSLTPLLKNADADWPHAAISTHEQNNHAITIGRWKYIQYADGSEELYDIQKDPGEWDNLVFPKANEENLLIIQGLKIFIPPVNLPQCKSIK